MENVKIKEESIVIDGVYYISKTFYHLKKGALGDYSWHVVDSTCELDDKKNKEENLFLDLDCIDNYQFKDKRAIIFNGVSYCSFQVWQRTKVNSNSFFLVKNCLVKSSGIARNQRCFNAYKNPEYGY